MCTLQGTVNTHKDMNKVLKSAQFWFQESRISSSADVSCLDIYVFAKKKTKHQHCFLFLPQTRLLPHNYFYNDPSAGWLSSVWISLTNKKSKKKKITGLFVVCRIFIRLSLIFNLGQVKFKYLINHGILKLNANRHRLITFSRGGSIYEMSLKIVYPQANRCQPPFRLNVSFAVNTERGRYGLGAGSWTPTCGFCAGLGLAEKALISDGAQYTVSWRPRLKLQPGPAGAETFGVNL